MVLAYGGEHPDSFGGYGLTWHSSEDASVFVAFSGDVAVHRDALDDLVDHPDELIVCQSVMSDVESAALLEELKPELAVRSAGWSEAIDGAIHVVLADFEESYAAELEDRYGERVEITVGEFPYPMPDPPPASQCGSPPASGAVAGLEISIDALSGPIEESHGSATTATVRLRNTGSHTIQFGMGSPSAILVRPGTAIVVGGSFGGALTAGLLQPVGLLPGDEQTIALSVRATSCDPSLGYRVPPGHYDLIAIVNRSAGEGGSLLSHPLAVEVL